jgi:hypothetical protein
VRGFSGVTMPACRIEDNWLKQYKDMIDTIMGVYV